MVYLSQTQKDEDPVIGGLRLFVNFFNLVNYLNISMTKEPPFRDVFYQL